MSLKSKAMLASLTIHKWGAVKSDNQANIDLSTIKQNRPNMSRVTKTLLKSYELVNYNTLAIQARTVFYAATMPWFNNGIRILPTKKFMDLNVEINNINDKAQNCIEHFCENYDTFIENAKTQLGSMFNITDYPDVDTIRSKFSISTQYMPVPNNDDWRVDLDSVQVEALKSEMRTTALENQKKAIKSLKDKTTQALSKMIDVLSETDDATFRKRLRESHVSDVTELSTFLTDMNVFGDDDLAQIIVSLNNAMPFAFDADDLKKDKSIKEMLFKNLSEVLTTVNYVL